MNNKLYFNNLAGTTTDQERMDRLSAHGSVTGIKLPIDRVSGRPRGFGFVTMATPEGAHAAIAALNGRAMGRTLSPWLRQATP